MADYILVDGDSATFLPTFGAATATPRPGKLQGSGPGTLDGRGLCVVGDEAKLEVPGCAYFTPQFSIPGVATLKIAALAENQKAIRTETGKKRVMLKGSAFTAKLVVTTPAQQPQPPLPNLPDPTPQYGGGSGSFVTSNHKFRGT